MKRIILLALLLSIGFLFVGSGCIQPPGNETANQTNLTAQPKVVLFYDPAGEGIKNQIVSGVKSHLPGVSVEEKCVDFTRLQYDVATDSEDTCIAKDGSDKYGENMQILLTLIENGATSPMFILENGDYKQAEYSLNPLLVANGICDVYAYSGCSGVPEPQPVKATLYAYNESDSATFSQLLTTIETYGVTLDYTTKVVDESDVSSIKQTTKADFLPVFLTEDADADSQVVLDIFVEDLASISGNLEGEKIGNRYAIYPLSMDAAYYIGDEPFINAVSYVPASNLEGWKGVFTGFSAEGLMLNISYTAVDGEAAQNVSDDTGEVFLPLLVIPSDGLTDAQKQKLDSLVGKPVTSSGVTRYLKKNGDLYVGYITYATADLYTGKKVDNVTIDIYIMSHCPYGLQMQKALIPVVELFGTSGKLDVNNKFVDYTMHGEQETTDNLIEYCVGKTVPAKEWSFLRCFIENSGDSATCMANLGIDQNAINSCVGSARTEFAVSGTAFSIYAEENELYGVSGSPTTVFMGKQMSFSRDPEAIKDFVCSVLAAPPTACSTTLAYNIESGFGPINGTGSSSSSSGSCS